MVLGGLNWDDIRSIMIKELQNCEQEIYIFEQGVNMGKMLLERQTEFTQKINNAIDKIIGEEWNTYYAAAPDITDSLFCNHYHVCTFSLISNDKKKQKKQCKKYIKKHNITVSLENYEEGQKPHRLDYCDYCPMSAYVALDEEGKLMVARHLGP